MDGGKRGRKGKKGKGADRLVSRGVLLLSAVVVPPQVPAIPSCSHSILFRICMTICFQVRPQNRETHSFNACSIVSGSNCSTVRPGKEPCCCLTRPAALGVATTNWKQSAPFGLHR
jgi:hypothetical protein